MRIRDWVETWGRGLDADPVGSALFMVRLLRSVVQREPATDLGVAEGILGLVEEYGDLSADVVRRCLADMGSVSDHFVTREFVVEMMEAEG